MNLLKNIKVKTRLIGAFLIVAIFIAIVGAVGTASLRNVDKNAEEMYSVKLQSINQILAIRTSVVEVKGELLTLMYDKDLSEKAEAEKNIKDRLEEDNKHIADLQKKTYDLRRKKNLGRIQN